MINSFASNSGSLFQLILLSSAKSALVNLTFYDLSIYWKMFGMECGRIFNVPPFGVRRQSEAATALWLFFPWCSIFAIFILTPFT
jgi:hypothetical protein